MPGPLESLCLAVALVTAAGGAPRVESPDLGVAELRQLLDGVPLGGGAATPETDALAGPVHPWRQFMEEAPHSRATVGAMLALLETTVEPERRSRLMQALSRERDPRLRPIWNGLIANGRPEDAERWAPFAFEGLLRIGEEEDHRLLMNLLGQDPRVDAWLMRALGRTGARWASELVLRTYRSEQEYEPLRVAAFDAALALTDDAALLLSEGLHHRARSIRLAALGNASLCALEAPVERLVELVEEPDAEIAGAARRLLERGCDSDLFRARIVRHLLARPHALEDAPTLLLALAEWADGAGELRAAEALYRRALPKLASGGDEQLRALYRRGGLLQLTGREREAAELGARLKQADRGDAGGRVVVRATGTSEEVSLGAAARALRSPSRPEAAATLAPLLGWQGWRIAIETDRAAPARVTVHRARICVPSGCFDAMEDGPHARALEPGEALRLYAGDGASGAVRGCAGYAVLEVSVDDAWRGRLLARCEPAGAP